MLRDVWPSNTMRKEPQTYNDLMASAVIDVTTLQEAAIQTAKDINAASVHIHPDNARTRHVLCRSNRVPNGRVPTIFT